MKKQSYKKVYLEIFEERCQLDGEGTPFVRCGRCSDRTIYKSELNVWHFAHTISKGADCTKKYDKSNIVIVCADCHGDEHTSGKFNNYTGIK